MCCYLFIYIMRIELFVTGYALYKSHYYYYYYYYKCQWVDVFSFGGKVFHKAGAADSNERAPKYFFLCPFMLGIFRSARMKNEAPLKAHT